MKQQHKLLQEKLDDFIGCLFDTIALVKRDTTKQSLTISSDTLKGYGSQILDSLERALDYEVHITRRIMEKTFSSSWHETLRDIFEDMLPLPELEDYMQAKDMQSVTVAISRNKMGELIISSVDYNI
jgi:hypothetical protein